MSRRFVSAPDSRSTLRELWQARHLCQQLIIRDLSVRYRQTMLGWLWAIVNPALNLTMYYMVFGVMVKIQTPEYNVSYTWVLLSGLILWMLFSSTMNAASESLMNNLHVIKKIYFPRVVLTLAAAMSSATDSVLSLLWLCILLSLSGIEIYVNKIPLIILCMVLVALCGWGLGSLLAILRLRFRDLRHLMPLLLQGMFYLTPVVWTPAAIPTYWRWLLMLNPISGTMAWFRYALLGGVQPAFFILILSTVSSLLLMTLGYCCFIRSEMTVTDRE